jgi:hypothetical protein
MMKRILMLTAMCMLVLSAARAQEAEAPYAVAWTRQFGTAGADRGKGIHRGADGSLYVAGSTTGEMGGLKAGYVDVFLSKFDTEGIAVWTVQIGTESLEEALSVATDVDGNVYITGSTLGAMDGPNAGEYDLFLVKFDSGGGDIWRLQLGDSESEIGHDVAADAEGNVYVAGYEHRASSGGSDTDKAESFLRKFDTDGNEIWVVAISTEEDDYAFSIAIDVSGNICLAGTTKGELAGTSAGGRDVFLSKFDVDGNESWMTQVGSPGEDHAVSIATDAVGDIYVVGATDGEMGLSSEGGFDSYIMKVNGQGEYLWAVQRGTAGTDYGMSIAADGDGNVFVIGWSDGGLGGEIVGGHDAYLSKFDSDGAECWTAPFGTSENDIANSIAIDAEGNVYVSGYTGGALGGPSAGGDDVFLMKFSPPDVTATGEEDVVPVEDAEDAPLTDEASDAAADE